MLVSWNRFTWQMRLASAAPTPTSDFCAASTSTVTSGELTVVWPVVLEEVWGGKPQSIAFNTLPKDDSDPSQGNFGIGATWDGTAWTSRQYTYVSFDIPVDAHNCALWSTFPTSQFDYEALSGLPNLEPQVQVFSPNTTIDPDNLSFWDAFPVDSAPNVDEFVSTQLNAGGDTHIADFDCIPDPNFKFIVGIADSTAPDAQEPALTSRVNNAVPRNYDFYVAYSRDISL
ncbi:hypothetical protein DSL72_005623 [Monilinia vaccinii-corymbosi]|uniref:Uncharacterized protein n=1 Tax=Monilinia vaccinii-corymbosi TaxID=61207 RepID=A0A8A3PG64_9HELO|nr:hypothetical protein DSL72_005623 [Monilinia vaccinii-corymbosi]